MKKQIFITNGTGGCGKDTFACILNDLIPTKKISSIDSVKSIASLCGWDGKKTQKDRKFLSDLKLLLAGYNDFPFSVLRNEVENFNSDFKFEILLIDIREPKEIERAVKEFKAKTILIKNNRVAPITSNMTDANVFNYKYDFIIENNGTMDEFRDTVKKFSKENIL